MSECEIVGIDELNEDDDLLMDYLISLENNPKTALNIDVNIPDCYKIVCEGNENGLHQGMNADPVKLYEQYKTDQNCLLFVISDVSQFYITFDVYERDNLPI